MTRDRMPDASCVVILRDGAVLAVSRKHDHSQYGLPGGKVERGESPEATAIRELEEETGYSGSPAQLQLVYFAKEPTSGTLVATYLMDDPGGAPCGGAGEPAAGVVAWVGWPALTQGPFGAYNAAVREALLDMPEHWAKRWGSGTLRRAIEEGLAWRELYLEERAAFEIGYGFKVAIRSRLTWGRALAESDSPATTETCWWARALRWRSERDQRAARVEVVHARLDDGEGGISEGIAIRYEPLARPAWLPSDRILVAFTTDCAGRTLNPC